MNTPVYDFLKKYSDSDFLRCHMPGHKGSALCGLAPELYSLDITEINGADSLFEAEGIIAESEKNMSRLYKTKATVFSAGGSTLCIQAMLYLMKKENRCVFAVRNVHRAFLNAAALLDMDVEWIMPDYSDSLLSGELSLSWVEKLLSECKKTACVYVTSPDYTGKLADIKGLSEICHRYGARLLVDNAHGAHLAFFPQSLHPVALGADLCCDSAHKMLPALTGAALLHTSREEYAPLLKQAMSVFGSTSPSYLIMCSLDLCCDYIDSHIREDIRIGSARIEKLKNNLGRLVSFADTEPFHITVKAQECGFSGLELADILREYNVECEYADESIVILLMAPSNTQKDYDMLENALEKALKKAEKYAPAVRKLSLPCPVRAMSIRDAVLAPSEEISVDSAENRICASVKVPCPPAVPIAVSGEIITRGHIKIFNRYGIFTVNVVK